MLKLRLLKIDQSDKHLRVHSGCLKYPGQHLSQLCPQKPSRQTQAPLAGSQGASNLVP